MGDIDGIPMSASASISITEHTRSVPFDACAAGIAKSSRPSSARGMMNVDDQLRRSGVRACIHVCARGRVADSMKIPEWCRTAGAVGYVLTRLKSKQVCRLIRRRILSTGSSLESHCRGGRAGPRATGSSPSPSGCPGLCSPLSLSLCLPLLGRPACPSGAASAPPARPRSVWATRVSRVLP